MQPSRRTGNYYQQQEQLYGSASLATNSLIARAHNEYKRMEDAKNREHILEDNKRRLILKL